MKHVPRLVSVFFILFFSSMAQAQRVVVIPLSSNNCSNDQADHKIVFVTSAVYSGDLGGVYGANVKCNQSAQNAGLTGSYKAWISTASSAPATTFNRSSVPYVLVNQTVIASDWDDLTDSILSHAVNMTETGGAIVGSAWTNTHPDGSAIYVTTTQTCSNFTSAIASAIAVVGTVTLMTSEWTRHTAPSCQESHHLYCIQQ